MKYKLAIVDDEEIVCRRLAKALGKDEFSVEAFVTGRSFLERMKQKRFDIVFLDMNLPDQDGLDILVRIKQYCSETEVIIITGYKSVETAVEAIRKGAYHYIAKPVNLSDIRLWAQNARDKISMRAENRRLREALKSGSGLTSIVGNSPAIQELFSMINKVAKVDCNVLIQGGSGTGKALVAQAIHQLSSRKDRAFVSFNCGGFTDELISSELFGHERGAFTGATAVKIGLLESASGGTVFLDEIGEMPLSMQVKLLHVIQERKIFRVGGTDLIDLDIRIIAATNKNLKKEVEEGLFREDLFFRLNVVSLNVPQLAERREDIPLLVNHFIQKYCLAFHKRVSGVEKEALHILTHYSYPGNVRELENIIERAVALTGGEEITINDLPRDLQKFDFDTLEGDGLTSLAEMERRYIKTVLESTGYNRSRAAEILDIPRTTLWRKIKMYGLG
ncbi:sigma-54-dependent transcriptional regulator [Desulfomarina sp.]